MNDDRKGNGGIVCLISFLTLLFGLEGHGQPSFPWGWFIACGIAYVIGGVIAWRESR